MAVLMDVFTAQRFITFQDPCLYSMFSCYWISQSLQGLKNCDLGDSSMLTRLQQQEKLFKLGAKNGCD